MFIYKTEEFHILQDFIFNLCAEAIIKLYLPKINKFGPNRSLSLELFDTQYLSNICYMHSNMLSSHFVPKPMIDFLLIVITN